MIRATALRSAFILAVFITLPLVHAAVGAENDTASALLPEKLEVRDEFTAGTGKPIGKVLALEGKAVIIHANEDVGYAATKNLPLFQKDTIVTLPNGRLKIRMNDASVLTLTPATRLVLSKSFYDPAAKSRLSFVNLTLGKARFWVTKLLDFTRSDFKVKTPTAMCGVRGSDFIVSVTNNYTEVTALEDTRLAVVSLAAPEAEPVMLDSFERTGIALGERPTAAVKVPRGEIKTIMKPFEFGDDAEEKEKAPGTGATGKKTGAAPASGDESAGPGLTAGALRSTGASATVDTAETLAEDETRSSQVVLLADEPAEEPAGADLVEPADSGVTGITESIDTAPFDYQSDPTVQGQAASNMQQEILEISQEEEVRSEFPGFPGPPK